MGKYNTWHAITEEELNQAFAPIGDPKTAFQYYWVDTDLKYEDKEICFVKWGESLFYYLWARFYTADYDYYVKLGTIQEVYDIVVADYELLKQRGVPKHIKRRALKRIRHWFKVQVKDPYPTFIAALKEQIDKGNGNKYLLYNSD